MVRQSVDCWKVGIMEELIDCINDVFACGLLEFWPHGGVDKLYIWCV